MITKEQFKKITALTLRVQSGEKVSGAEFTEMYNSVFNATVKFSNCCPSENKNRLNRLRAEAKKFKTKYKKEAEGIISELTATPTAEEKEAPKKEETPKKKKRGRPRKNPTAESKGRKEDGPEK